MKLVKNILTLILFLTTFLIINVAQYFTMSLITMPGGDNVERVHLFPDIMSQEVTYSDAISFWIVDINESLVNPGEEPEYTIRGWFDYSIWYDNMRWADYLYSQGKAIVVPILAPVYEIKELYTYYGKDITDFIITPEPGKLLTIEQASKNTAIQNYSVYGIDVIKNVDRDNYEYVHNLLLKIDKYNRVDENGLYVYRQFVNKFIIYNGDLNGEYEFTNVNALSVFVYYQIFLAIILSMYFTYQNPIVIKRNENNENEVEGRILPRLPKIGFGNRNKQRYQQQYQQQQQQQPNDKR
jgi:hypothetical protein